MDPNAILDAIGALPDADIDLAEAALHLGRIDAPDADWQAARAHLTDIARAIVAAARAQETDSLEDRADALARVLVDRFGYHGDDETYDDLANANLLRVIERRRGMPVALGILWLHAAEAASWAAVGIDMPGHFLVGLEGAGQRLLLDVFDGGAVLSGPELRSLARRAAGREAPLARLLAPMEKRGVLLRLQANIIRRRETAGDYAGALTATETALRFAPAEAGLWHEAGALQEKLDMFAAALDSYRRFLDASPPGPLARQVQERLDALRARLN